MDDEDLLDYVLGQLDGPRRAEVERAAAADPALAARLARLARNLGRLLDDGLGSSPTSGPSHATRPPTTPGRHGGSPNGPDTPGPREGP
jgi:anti-sigma factor RsiW